MRVAFLVPDLHLSGGINVVVRHAVGMADRPGWSVSILVTAPTPTKVWPYPDLERIDVRLLSEAHDEHFDVVLATWWGTVRYLPLVSADRYAYFAQSLEDRFPRLHQTIDIHLAGVGYHLGIPIVTEASWIYDLIRAHHPNIPSYLVRNGIDKEIFAIPEAIEPRVDGPLRILVEGSRHVPFKGVPEALAAASRMRADHHVTLVAIDDASPHPAADVVLGPMSQIDLAKLYAEIDVLVKLPRVEGMFGPPLEAMHLGATSVVTPVTGHDMYIRHGWNALVTAWDDERGTAALLDVLAADRRLLHRLRINALETARAWPSWEESTNRFSLAMTELAAAPSTVERRTLAGVVRHLWTLSQTSVTAADEVVDDLAVARRQLVELDASRWLRALELAEQPIRRYRPGLGSVRRRIRRAVDTMDATVERIRPGG